MKAISLIVLFSFLLLSRPNCLHAQEPIPDENLGMGIVELSMDREESAKEYFRKSWSVNASAILERIEHPRASYHFQFDYRDPTLIGFYDYIVYVSKKPKYSFFAEIVKELDARNPNKELGELGLFYNAHFSPKSTYLTIYCSNKMILLESNTGNVVELVDLNDSLKAAYIVFSKDEKFILRYVEMQAGKTTKKVITYEDFKSKKVIWKKEMRDRVRVSFSKDSSKVIIFNYKAGSEFTNVYIYEIESKTGKEITKKQLKNMERDGIKDLFAHYTAIQFDYSYPVDRVESPDKKYLLVGNSTYGNYTLKTIGTNRTVREFRFASDIE